MLGSYVLQTCSNTDEDEYVDMDSELMLEMRRRAMDMKITTVSLTMDILTWKLISKDIRHHCELNPVAQPPASSNQWNSKEKKIRWIVSVDEVFV